MDDLIAIENNGPLIASTNYWTSDHAQRGLFFLSWNAGAARLLVPEACLGDLSEMQTDKTVVITRGNLDGHDALEILFDDGTDSPFALNISTKQCDRLVPETPEAFVFIAWGETGELARWTAHYRVRKALPCLEQWA